VAAIEITIPESTSTDQAAAVMVFALLGLLPCIHNGAGFVGTHSMRHANHVMHGLV
jgi:hypothetical protein